MQLKDNRNESKSGNENESDEEIEFKNINAIDSSRSKESVKVDNNSIEENRSEKYIYIIIIINN